MFKKKEVDMKINYIPKTLDEAEEMYFFQKPDMTFEDFLVLIQEEKDMIGEEDELMDYKSWKYYQ